MSRIIRMGIVLGIAVAALVTSAAIAAQVPSDAFERAVATNESVVATDAHQRAVPFAVVATDAHQRISPADVTITPLAAEDSGWSVNWTAILLGVAIGAGLVVAAVLMTNAIRRHPPRGHPPLAHR